MKVTPDDPKLSAYLLGELSPEESLQVEHAAASDPAIGMSLDELRKMTGFLDEVFGTSGSAGLMPPQREAIRRASRDADSLGKIVELGSVKRGSKPWIAGLGAAAAVAIAALLMSRVEIGGSSSAGSSGALGDEVALLPMPGPSSASASTIVASDREPADEQRRNLDNRPGEFLREVSRHLERTPPLASVQLPATSDLSGFNRGPDTRLPIVVGSASLRWVHGWIWDKRQLPPRNAVRIEELINSASLPGGDEDEGLRVAIELMPCPWDARSTLAAVQVTATEEAVREFKLVFHSDAERRVLGSFPIREDERMPVVLPAGRKTLVMLELRGSGGGSEKLELQRGDQLRSLSFPNPDREVSTGMRYAAALAGFGMWLRDEGVTAAELRQMLSSLGEDPDSVRAEVRRMMEEALNLARPER